MSLNRDKAKREEMGIEELTLNGWVYKRKPTISIEQTQKKRENKEPT